MEEFSFPGNHSEMSMDRFSFQWIGLVFKEPLRTRPLQLVFE